MLRKVNVNLSSTASPSFSSLLVWILSCPIHGVAALQAVHHLAISHFSFQIHIPQRCTQVFTDHTLLHLRDIGLAEWQPSQFPHQLNCWAVRVHLFRQYAQNYPKHGEVKYNGNHLGATKVSATCGAFGTRNIIAFLQKDRMSIQIVMFSGCDKRISTSGVWNSGLCLAFR